MEDHHYCIICERKLNPKTMKWIGMCQETAEWTLDEEKATQGFFEIGSGCYKTLIKNGEL